MLSKYTKILPNHVNFSVQIIVVRLIKVFNHCAVIYITHIPNIDYRFIIN